MKPSIYHTITILLFIVFSFQFSVFGNDNDKVFPTDNAIWNVFYLSKQPTIQYYYGMTGDTIINDIAYSKLYLLNDSTLVIDENDIYVGGIRQKDKVVYMQPATNQWGFALDEYIFYDFSKSEGEYISFKSACISPMDNKATFDNISVVYDFENVKIEREEHTMFGRIIALEYAGMEEWIEGIGSKSGFFFTSIASPTDGSGIWYGGILGCMIENGEIKYFDENCESCLGKLKYDPNESRSIAEKENNSQLFVYYNTLSKNLEIKTSTFPLELSLYKLTGEEILKTSVTEKKYTINSFNLPSGMYIYSLSNDNTAQTGKIIINP